MSKVQGPRSKVRRPDVPTSRRPNAPRSTTNYVQNPTSNKHVCEAQTVERSIRSETAKSYRKQRGIKRRREKKKKEETSSTLAAPPGQGRGPTDPPWPSLYSSSKPRRSACRLFIDTSEPPASLSLASMGNSNSERRKRQNEGVKLRLRAFHVLRLQEATTHNEA